MPVVDFSNFCYHTEDMDGKELRLLEQITELKSEIVLKKKQKDEVCRQRDQIMLKVVRRLRAHENI